MKEPRKSATTRGLALDQYVVKLGLWSLEHIAAGENHQARFDVGGRAVTLDPFELALLQPADADAVLSEQDALIGNLAIESIALLSKCFEDLGGLHPGPGLYAAQAELMLDSALGALLLDESQRCIDTLVVRGEVGTAKALTKVRHRLRRALTEVGAALKDAENARVQDLSASLGVEPEEPSARPARPCEVRSAKARPLRRSLARLSPRRIVQDVPPTKLLSGALAVVVAAWLVLFGLPRLRDATPARPAVVHAAELGGGGLVLSVDRRHGSVYGVVDAGVWSAMSDDDRVAAIAAIGHELDRLAYNGAIFRTDEGTPAAQWLAGSGPRVLERSRNRQE